MRWPLLLVACLLPLVSVAAPWQFDVPVAVTRHTGPKVFHHLESAGRRSIAVSGESVAIAWEDNRDGTPRIYLALKGLDDAGFTERDTAISGAGEAYEPAIAALPGDRFVVAWEEDEQIRVRLVTAKTVGPILSLGTGAAQASLAALGDDVLLVGAVREKRFSRIRLHHLQVDADLKLTETVACPVDAEPPQDEQLYPALAVTSRQLVVAWEDRRPGHTIIMAARSPAESLCRFSPPQRISLRPEDVPDMPYGKGSGAMRVVLAGFGDGRVLAAWADKRDFREGYDIYGAIFDGQTFGPNVRIQSEFGGVALQWHASASGTADGELAVVWDDERDGNADLMLSRFEGDAWSEDEPVPGASGPGEQVHPSIVLDARGNLHVAWVERGEADGPSRVLYAVGRKAEGGE